MTKRTAAMFAAVFAAALAAAEAQAGPYFKLKPFAKIETGAFFKLGTPQGDNVQLGIITPVVWHDSADGHLLVPGVDWTLLNLGAIAPTDLRSGTLLIGPSVSLNEPVKAALRLALDMAPGCRDGGCGALRHVLKPASSGNNQMYLDVGPMWGIDTGNWRGSLLIGSTLSRRF